MISSDSLKSEDARKKKAPENKKDMEAKGQNPVLHPTYDGNHFDEFITEKQLKDLKKYLEDPNREIFEEKDSED